MKICHYRIGILPFLVGVVTGNMLYAETPKTADLPNILIIYADDIGFGDLSCYGNRVVATPNADRIAKEGIRFTDAYSSAATCTPSRYSLMTGQCAWRKSGTQILPGDAKIIIEPGRQTLPSVLKTAGYMTGIVGKWHLGLSSGDTPIDWNHPVKPGPNEIGFDYTYVMPATMDRVPCVYMENGMVCGLDPNDPIEVNYKKKIGNDPTGRENPELLKMKHSVGHDMTIVNGVGRIGWMTGGHKARWRDQDMADRYIEKSLAFLDSAVSRKQPFFLFFATGDIHVPRLPHERFAGKSKLGARGDALLEFDWSVGQLLHKLDTLGVAENTIVILSSDNGPVLDDGYADSAVALNDAAGHHPGGILRGSKCTFFEGGCRVPFLVRAPKQIKNPNTVSSAIISQMDLLATFAEMNGQHADSVTASDSLDMRAPLFGNSPTGREFVVLQGLSGLSMRYGKYKYIPTQYGKKQFPPSLYDLQNDPGEKHNISEIHQNIIQSLQQKFDNYTQGKVFLR